MRFKRMERYGPRALTDRQKGTYARKLVREQARYPLFADHVAAEQRSLDEETLRRDAARVASEQSQRAFYSRVWRESRALYFAQPAEVRTLITAKWRAWTGPCTATYFAWMVDVESGQQARRLARIEQEEAPRRERLRRQLDAMHAATLDL